MPIYRWVVAASGKAFLHGAYDLCVLLCCKSGSLFVHSILHDSSYLLSYTNFSALYDVGVDKTVVTDAEIYLPYRWWNSILTSKGTIKIEKIAWKITSKSLCFPIFQIRRLRRGLVLTASSTILLSCRDCR